MIYGNTMMSMMDGRSVVSQFGFSISGYSKMDAFFFDPIENNINSFCGQVSAEYLFFFYQLKMRIDFLGRRLIIGDYWFNCI